MIIKSVNSRQGWELHLQFPCDRQRGGDRPGLGLCRSLLRPAAPPLGVPRKVQSASVARSQGFCQKLLWKFPRPVGHTTERFFGKVLGSSPGLWDATAASYCPSRVGNSLKLFRKTSPHDGMGNSVQLLCSKTRRKLQEELPQNRFIKP